MRIRIEADGATTEQVREMAVALHRIGFTGELQVGCEGPEHWKLQTPNLSPAQFAQVVGHIVRVQGQSVVEYIGEEG